MAKVGEALGAVERELVWGMAFGSSSDAFRPAIFRPHTVPLGPDEKRLFSGDPMASRWNRRAWKNLGIVVIRKGALLEAQQKHPDGTPVVIAQPVEGQGMIGRLRSTRDIGEIMPMFHNRAGGNPDLLAHGMRLGRDAVGIALGWETSGGEIHPFTLHPEDQRSIPNMVEVSALGGDGGRYQDVHFS